MSSDEYVKECLWEDYKPGDKLTGIMVDILSNVGRYGNTVYKIQNDDGIFSVWGSQKLDEQMEKINVEIGMNLIITYNGLIHTANGYDMKDFTVINTD